MGLTAILFLATLGLTGVLLRMMGMPFDYVALIVVGMLFTALVGVLAVLQIQENRTRRWLEKKWFPDHVAQRFKPTPWYQRRPYQWSAGLLGLVAVVVVPLLVLLMRSPNPAPDLARAAPAQPSSAATSVATRSTATPTAAVTAAVTATAPTPATPTENTPATTTATAPATAAQTTAPVALAALTHTPTTEERAALQAAVQAWAQAWSAGDAEAYLSHYSAAFKPATNQPRSAWERTRRQRVTPEQQIRVDLDEVELMALGNQQAQMQFVQRYAAKRLQDRSRKQLDWVLENGQWKIAAETVLATLTP